MRYVLVSVSLALAVASCGGDDSSDQSARPATTDTPTATRPRPSIGPPGKTEGGTVETPTKTAPRKQKPKTGAAAFTGVHRRNYETARTVCGSFPRRKVARDLKLDSTDPAAIADAYADLYLPTFRQANFAGCLAGLR